MKLLIVLFICLGSFAFGKDVQESFEVKCRDNAGNENAFVELQGAFSDYDVCRRGLFKSAPPNPMEDHEGFCNYIRSSGFYGCVENLAIGVSPCLADTEKYFPDFVLTGINSTYDELCGVEGVGNSKLFYNHMTGIDNCHKRIRGLHWGIMQCLSELTAMKNLDNGIINLNKRDVCFDLDSFQTCMGDLMETACEENYSEFVRSSFRPFIQECNDVLHGEV